MSLLVLVPSSSFLFEPYFKQLIKSQPVTPEQLNHALDLNINSAHYLNFNQAKVGSRSWLDSGHDLSDSYLDVAYSLAKYFFTNDEADKARFYFEKSIALGHQGAAETLAKLAYQSSEFQRVLALIAEFNLSSSEFLQLKVKSLMALGELEKLHSMRELLYAEQRDTDFLNDLIRFNVYGAEGFEDGGHCPFSITVIAGQYEDLKRWQFLSESYQQSPLSPYLCIKQIRYVPEIEKRCHAKKGMAISCDEGGWETYAETIDSDYLAMILPEGGANVHYGILYLDREDDIHVFNHEISHLLGFIDEYPLTSSHNACKWQDFDVGYNISVIQNEELSNNHISLSQAKQLPWFEQLADYIPAGADELPLNKAFTDSGEGIFIADTCRNNLNHSALKPTSARTSLTNHDIEMPNFYLELLAKSPARFNMPSFEFNIAHAYLNSGNLTKANHWLKKAKLYRSKQLTERLLEKGY